MCEIGGFIFMGVVLVIRTLYMRLLYIEHTFSGIVVCLTAFTLETRSCDCSLSMCYCLPRVMGILTN